MAPPKARRKARKAGAADEAAAGKEKHVRGALATGEEVAALSAAVAEALRYERQATETAEASSGPRESLREEAPALLGVVQQLRRRVESLRGAAAVATDRFLVAPGSPDDGARRGDGASAFVEMKVQVLLSYLSALVYYMLLKASGSPVRGHPVLQRLQWTRAFLEKMRPIDSRLHYQVSRALELANQNSAGPGAAGASGALDPKALRPGELANTVDDEAGEEDDEIDEAPAKEDDVYRPPRIAQMEYTGDHVTEQDRAQKDLERKRSRLERSEFMRSLREEFTDAPVEVHGRIRSNAAEKAERKLREQQEYEEENMVRLRSSKKDLAAQKRLLKKTYVDTGGAVSLNEAADFGELAMGTERSAGRGRQRGGTALSEYQDALSRVKRARGVVASTLSGSLPDELQGGRKRGPGGGKAGGKGKKRRAS